MTEEGDARAPESPNAQRQQRSSPGPPACSHLAAAPDWREEGKTVPNASGLPGVEPGLRFSQRCGFSADNQRPAADAVQDLSKPSRQPGGGGCPCSWTLLAQVRVGDGGERGRQALTLPGAGGGVFPSAHDSTPVHGTPHAAERMVRHNRVTHKH